MIGPIATFFLDEMIKHDASDMYIAVGYPASARKGNELIPVSQPIQPEDTLKFANEVLNESQKEEFESSLELNLSVIKPDGSRFRFNFLRQQQQTSIVIRRINMYIPTLEELGLPEVYSKAIMRKRGLILLASPGGSGKSTSMAAMIGHRNRNATGHILTIEDPIEFIHPQGKCILTQREIGTDTYSYSMALKNALRQRADVIAIGEIRERETLEHALRFAETGHLCIATLHSNNAHQAVTRMVNLFPDDARNYILATISQNLISIFSQRILKDIKNKGVVVSEMLLNEGLIRTLICDNRLSEIKEAMERSKDTGMQTFDQAIYKLYENGRITPQEAIDEADNPATLRLKITQSRQDISGMHMNMLDKNVF